MSLNSKMCRAGVLAVIAGGMLAGTAQAELLVGLTTTGQLVSFDHASPGVILATSPMISGLGAGDSIVDIDYYPVTQSLHGLGSSGVLYRIDRFTGAATVDVMPQMSMGTPRAIDFNPAADRLRVLSGPSNFRLTPSVNTAGPTGANAGLVSADGMFTYGAGGPTPNLVAAAYTNNFDGTATTTLYSIDTGLDALVIHSGAPQFSTLATVGGLGVNVGERVGFDISPSGANYVSNGNDLYTINLMNGSLSSIGTIGGNLSVATIAVVVPGPGPAALGALGALSLAVRRRRR